MHRIQYLLGIVAMLAVMVAAVWMGSSYSPVVHDVVDIEEIWAIEDARVQSEEPLVTRLDLDGIPLAYDSAENTFYCNLGLGRGTSWPDIHLHATGTEGVKLVFVDDYQYDFCADAIREGYAYQILSYTDTEYAYLNVVFTGMQQIQLFTQEAITEVDVPAEAIISDHNGALISGTRVHYRGAKSITYPKKGLRIEFTKTDDGKGKIARDVPGIGQMENLILIPMYLDQTLMRDRLCWMMYEDVATAEESFGTRKTQYAELFVNGSYEGVYLMIEPYDNEVELAKQSPANPQTDSIYRIRRTLYAGDRPLMDGVFIENRAFELRYMPEGAEMFADLADYVALAEEEDDEVFAQKALECMDMDSTLRYMILLQGLGLTDNVFNNMNIWARHEDGRVIYHYFLWDLDDSLGERSERIGSHFDHWIYLPIADRMLNLNVGGMRQKLHEQWTQLRSGPWSEENFIARVAQCSAEVNDSGASVRNAQRWGNENAPVDAYELINFISSRYWLMDQVIEYIAQEEGPIEMLEYTDYDSKSGPIPKLE